MVRSGLRMMPTFPSPSLKVGSRTDAKLLRSDLSVAPRFLWECLTNRHSRSWLLYPRGPRSGLGYIVPVHLRLLRPHPSHSQTHPDFTAVRFIRDAFAVLVRLGDPRLVPCFRCSFLVDMPPSTTPGSPSAAFAQFFANGVSLRRHLTRLGTPIYPIFRFRGKNHFGASLVRYLLRPVDPLASLADPTGLYPSQRRLLHPSFQRVDHSYRCRA